MSDAREALVALLHNEGDGGIWEHFDRKNSEAVADAILAAGWSPPGERVKPSVEVGVCEHQNANYLRMMSERDALRAEVERLREGAGRALVDRDAYRAELDEARQQVADLRARIEALDILGPDESRDPDAAPMSGEEVRWRPASAVPDSADVRERVWQALRESRRNGLGGMTEAQALDHMTDAVLAVVRPSGKEG